MKMKKDCEEEIKQVNNVWRIISVIILATSFFAGFFVGRFNIF